MNNDNILINIITNFTLIKYYVNKTIALLKLCIYKIKKVFKNYSNKIISHVKKLIIKIDIQQLLCKYVCIFLILGGSCLPFIISQYNKNYENLSKQINIEEQNKQQKEQEESQVKNEEIQNENKEIDIHKSIVSKVIDI